MDGPIHYDPKEEYDGEEKYGDNDVEYIDDKLQSDRVAATPEISALLEDEEVLERLAKEKIEMGVSDTMPAVKFQVILPGEFFLEQLLLVRTRLIKSY